MGFLLKCIKIKLFIFAVLEKTLVKTPKRIAFGFSLIIVVASSFMLLNVDKVPAVNMSKHNQTAAPGQFRKMQHQAENQDFYTQSTHQDTMSRDSLENPQNLIESSPPIHLVKKNK